MVAGGDGLAREEGLVWFVPGLWPGETALVREVSRKKGLVRGAVEEILEPSPNREEPFCPAAGECGGCPWQGMRYSAQVGEKRAVWRETWERMLPAWRDVPLDGIFASEPRGARNRIQLHAAGADSEGSPVLGMMARGENRVVPLESCPAAAEGINRRWEDAAQVCRDPAHRGPAHRDPACRDQRVILVGDAERAAVGGLDSRGEWLLAGKRVVMDPQGFFQGHFGGVEYLAHQLRDYFSSVPGKRDTLYDLYGGVGLGGKLLEDHFSRLVGVELNRNTAAAARENWGERGTVFSRDLGRWLNGGGESLRGQLADEGSAVLVDPPRRGLDKDVRRQIRRTPPPELIYISCNPVTQARDLSHWQDIYRPARIYLMDFYPHTPHMETAVVLSRKDL